MGKNSLLQLENCLVFSTALVRCYENTHISVTGEVVKQYIKYYLKFKIHHQHRLCANIYAVFKTLEIKDEKKKKNPFQVQSYLVQFTDGLLLAFPLDPERGLTTLTIRICYNKPKK